MNADGRLRAQPAAWTGDENSLYFLTAKRKTLYECESFPFGGGTSYTQTLKQRGVP